MPDSQPQPPPPFFRLTCRYQQYAWGKPGTSSKVAQLSTEACRSTSASAPPVDTGKPYAELWMGTHPNAPSSLYDHPQTTLLSLIQRHPQKLLGAAVASKFQNDLPFLFKVLSIEQALSIQAHPDKALAKRLHTSRPDVYKDPNHKPEIAIALTPFEGLCGFKRLEELAIALEQTPELRRVVGNVVAQEFQTYVREYNLKRRASESARPEKESNNHADRQVLRGLFEALMKQRQSVVEACLAALLKRLPATGAERGSTAELVHRLAKQYPNDVGVFCSFFLNYIYLLPGQSMFLSANEPHAYLSGDCVECMATSDNVVRAGLTPKLKDVDVLVGMLTYDGWDAEDLVSQGEAMGAASKVYRAPVQEFSVMMTNVDGATEMPAIQGPSVLIIVQGECRAANERPMPQGSVWFLAAGEKLAVTSGRATVYRAFCE